MDTTKPLDTRITVKMTVEDLDAVRQLASVNRTGVATIIRQAVVEWLERQGVDNSR